MLTLIFTGLATILASGQAKSHVKFDRQEIINGVNVFTAKENKDRLYRGHVVKYLEGNLQTVETAITSFSEKCNADYVSKRTLTNKNTPCLYHNNNLVETQIIKDIKKNYTPEKHEIDRYLLGRVVYNRGIYQYYEVVKIYEFQNEKGQAARKIVTEMISDKEAAKYTKPVLKNNSAFNYTVSNYTLTQVELGKVQLDYEYIAQTDHWMLNKDIAVPQVFSSMGKSISEFLDSVKLSQERNIASNK